ncbi:MAG: dihydropteroate synthase [Planctomycetota bacterium]|nr:dihydropteroate synthase [Planctomycetota bacterium]|tara:strand:- start:1412 stop:2413 length:1002 start_codon:yes stop_codon:yes gene_type:complete
MEILRELGLLVNGPLPDGSWSYFPSPALAPDPALAAGDVEDPSVRANWIGLRVAAGMDALSAPLAKPQLMVVLNLTEDSFSDGGKHLDSAQLLSTAQKACEAGATWLDLGAESTRPGAKAVPATQQIERLLPAMDLLRGFDVQLSVDTRSAAVAEAVLLAGAHMMNDVSSLEDPAMGGVVAHHGCDLVLMHMKGTPADMRQHCDYSFLLGEVLDGLARRAAKAIRAEIAPEKLVLDPGIGFAKTAEQSLELLGRFDSFRALGFPLLSGPSRKSFLSIPLGDVSPENREGGTAGAAAVSAAKGASILRLHDAGDPWDATQTAWACATHAQGVAQ